MSFEEERGGRRGKGQGLPELNLTDPMAMRALAHPVRMALLELLDVNDTLTATQASELLGESPANCAFHLRTLARYGFAEETGGGRGRERPWRAVPMRIHIESEKLDTPAAIAADTLSAQWLERSFQRARQAMRRGAPLPEGWEGAPTSTHGHTYLTRAELEQFAAEVLKLFSRYDNRHDPACRPPGSQPVELMFLGYPVTGMTVAGDESADDLSRLTTFTELTTYLTGDHHAPRDRAHPGGTAERGTAQGRGSRAAAGPEVPWPAPELVTPDRQERLVASHRHLSASRLMPHPLESGRIGSPGGGG